MADQRTHILQGEHNHATAQKLADEKVSDWSVTCSFYSAIHFVEAAFINNPKIGHSEDQFNKLALEMPEETKNQSLHAFRELLIRSALPNIRSKFAQLRNMSQSARYIERTGGKVGYEFITEENAKKALEDLKVIITETTK